MSRTEMMMAEWMRHRDVLPQILEQVDADKIHFTPWVGAMDLGKLAVHLVASSHNFVSSVASGEFVHQAAPEFESKDDVVRIVHDYTEKTKAVYGAITDTQLEEILDASFMHVKAPKAAFLGMMRDHEVHHKGQLFVYVRMTGAREMPFFISVHARGKENSRGNGDVSENIDRVEGGAPADES